jgi:hypothetical protein
MGSYSQKKDSGSEPLLISPNKLLMLDKLKISDSMLKVFNYGNPKKLLLQELDKMNKFS